MLVGYARTSTINQEAGFEAQEVALNEIGCEKIFKEQTSAIGPRPELCALLDFIREGDTLVVTKLDRLARSVAHLGEIVTKLEEKGADLRILNINIDTATPTGKLMLNLLGSVAQFEREMMLERQREGIAKAKAEGKYKGRAPTARRKTADVMRMTAEGKGPAEIARELEIGRASVYRILKDQKDAA